MGWVMVEALSLQSFQVGTVIPRQICDVSSLQLLLCLWDVAVYPWH